MEDSAANKRRRTKKPSINHSLTDNLLISYNCWTTFSVENIVFQCNLGTDMNNKNHVESLIYILFEQKRHKKKMRWHIYVSTYYIQLTAIPSHHVPSPPWAYQPLYSDEKNQTQCISDKINCQF